MAKTSQKVAQQRPPKYKTRGYNRCRKCGRARAYYRKFGLCRHLPARAGTPGLRARDEQVELVAPRP